MKRPFPTRRYIWALGSIILFALLPFLAGLFAEGWASLAGCNLHASPAEDCTILSQDFRSLLYATGMLTWLAPLTIVYGTSGIMLWALVLVTHVVWRRFSGKAGSE